MACYRNALGERRRSGRPALSGGETSTVQLWDVETGKLLRNYAGHDDNLTSVAFSPDGKLFVSGSAGQTVRVWPVTTSSTTVRRRRHV